MATYQFWRKLFTHLLIYLKGNGHPASLLGGDGHIYPYIKTGMATSTYSRRRGWPPIYLFWNSLSIYLPTHLSRRKWPPTTYLGADGHVYPPIWEGMATYLPI